MDKSVSPPEAEFQLQVLQALDRQTSCMVTVLRQVIGHDYPDQVAAVAFEVFSDGFQEGFPVRMYLMDKDDLYVEQDRSGGRRWMPVNPGLLQIDRVYGPELPESLHAVLPDADDWGLATDSLIRWFGKCWIAAGGLAFRRRAWIQHHDSIFRFDLAKQDWYQCE
ncbi:MAG: hypothetical protein R3F29_14495 [Planctomycetota bacterium]